MTPARLALDEETVDGRVVREVAWFDDGTVQVFEGGLLVEARPQTALEASRFVVSDAPADVRLDALLSDLAKATSLAQVRAAAAKAAEA